MKPLDQDLEQIKGIIHDMSRRYERKNGAVIFAGIDEGVVKVAPSGFCWQ